MRSIARKTLCALLMGMCAEYGLSIVYGQEPQDPNQDAPSHNELNERARQFREARELEREKQKQQQEQLRREQEEASSRARERMFTLDEPLQQAWSYFADSENRRREVAIDKFNVYLKDHPDTIFAPEIYYRIGQLYSARRNEKFKEQYDPRMMAKYYQLAVDSFGPGYSRFKDVAWASIVNQSGKTLEDRCAFYDWLCSWKQAKDPNAIYPVKSMEVLAQGNSTSPYLDEKEKLVVLKSLQDNLPQFIWVTEKNIFDKSTPEERLAILKLYPDSEMARQIKRLLNRDVRRLIDDEVDALTETSADDSLAASEGLEANASVVDVLSEEAASGFDQNSTDSTDKSSSKSDVQEVSRIGTTTARTVGCLSALSLVSLLVLLQRRWCHTNKKPGDAQ